MASGLHPFFNTDRKEWQGPTERTTSSSDPAPAFEGSGGRLGTAKNEGEGEGGRLKRLHLMHPPASNISATCCAAVVPTSFKIDLRGCSRRPTPLPPADSSSSGAGRLSSPSIQRADLRPEAKENRPRSSRRRRKSTRAPAGGLKHVKGTGWLDPAGNRSSTLYARKGTTDTASGVLEAPTTRSLRPARHLAVLAGGPDCQHPLGSEAQDTDELNSLLSVSRRIFSKAEAFADVKNRPQQQLSRKKLALQGHAPAVACSEQPSKTGLALAHPPGGSGGTLCLGVAREPTSSSSVVLPSKPGRTKTPNSAPKTVKKSRESSGTTQAICSSEQETGDRARLDHVVDEVDEYPGLETARPIESAPTPMKVHEISDTSDGMEAADRMRGYAADTPGNECATCQPPEDTDNAAQVAVVAGKEQTVMDSEHSAAVVDVSNYDGPLEASDAAEWVYDETTRSWYPAFGEGNGQEYIDRGWRYDEQSGTWYQEEAVRRDPGTQEPSSNMSAAVTTGIVANTDVVCVSGEECTPLSGDEHMETTRTKPTCDLRLKGDIDKNVREQGRTELELEIYGAKDENTKGSNV